MSTTTNTNKLVWKLFSIGKEEVGEFKKEKQNVILETGGLLARKIKFSIWNAALPLWNLRAV